MSDKKKIIRPDEVESMPKPAPLEFRDMSDRQYNARLSALEMANQRNQDLTHTVRAQGIQLERQRLVINQLSEQLTSVVAQTQEHLNALRADVTQVKYNQELQARTLVDIGVVTEEQFKDKHASMLEEIKKAMAEKAAANANAAETKPDEAVGEPTPETSPEGADAGNTEPAAGPVGSSDDGPVRI